MSSWTARRPRGCVLLRGGEPIRAASLPGAWAGATADADDNPDVLVLELDLASDDRLVDAQSPLVETRAGRVANTARRPTRTGRERRENGNGQDGHRSSHGLLR